MPAAEGCSGQDRVEPELGEKPGVERVVGVDEKAAVEPHPGSCTRLVPGARGRAVGFEDKLLAQPHQVEPAGVDPGVVADVGVAVAGPAERVFLPLHLDHGDRAAPVAAFLAALAGEGLAGDHLAVGQGRQIEGLLGDQAGLDPFLDLQGDAEGAHQAGLRRDDDGLADQGGHGQGHGAVVAHPALHEDLRPHRPVAFDAVRVVHADRVHQPGDDVLVGHPLVDGVLDVRGDEGRALVVEVGRLTPLEGDRGDLLHAHAQGFEGRFLQKRAGAGRTGLVHGVVRGHAVGDVGVLGVLAADFEDGVHLGVEVHRRGGVGDDLVDDPVGQGVQPGDLAARTAHPQPRDPDPGRVRLAAHLIEDFPVAAARGAHRVPVGAQVDRGQQGVVPAAHQDRLGGRGAHIEAEEAVVPGAHGTPFDGLELHLAG